MCASPGVAGDSGKSRIAATSVTMCPSLVPTACATQLCTVDSSVSIQQRATPPCLVCVARPGMSQPWVVTNKNKEAPSLSGGLAQRQSTHASHLTGPALLYTVPNNLSLCKSALKISHCRGLRVPAPVAVTSAHCSTTPRLSQAPPMLSQAPDDTLHLLHCVQVVGGCHTCDVHVCRRHLSTGDNTQHTHSHSSHNALSGHASQR